MRQPAEFSRILHRLPASNSKSYWMGRKVWYIPVHFHCLSLEWRYSDQDGEFNNSALVLIAEALTSNRIVNINNGESQLLLDNIICSEEALTLEYDRHRRWTRRSARHRLRPPVRQLQGSDNASYTDRKACAIFARGIPGQAGLRSRMGRK